MGKYRIRIFPAAQDDLREIVDYLNTMPPQAAPDTDDLIIESIETLADMPKQRPLVKDVQLRLRGYRTLPAKNYIVFFVVNENAVEIRRILYFRRRYEPLL